MSKLGNIPISQAFVTDQFSGTGSQTAFTMSVAPAATSAVLVAISGVLQDPSTYSVSGTTLTFSAAPPSGTGNISCRYLGIPASGVATTAYRTVTEFTATSGQTTFTVPSYVAGFISVYRNGALLGTADYTATNGTTVVLAVGAVAGDLVAVESFYVSSVLNAIPNTPRGVSTNNLPTGTVLQVVSATKTDVFTTTSTSFVDVTGLSVSITPTTATSKILIITQVSNGGGNGNASHFKLSGGNSANYVGNASGSLYRGVFGGYYLNDQTSVMYGSSMVYLDSPGTTSQVTYTVQTCKGPGGTNPSTVNILINEGDNNRLRGASSITLMEIAA